MSDFKIEREYQEMAKKHDFTMKPAHRYDYGHIVIRPELGVYFHDPWGDRQPPPTRWQRFKAWLKRWRRR